MSFLEVRNVSKTYPNGFHVLKNININVESGDMYGIIGLSGAGKSTLMQLLNRLEDTNEGQILLNGDNILDYSGAELRKYRNNIGMIFQHFNLLSSRTVYGNVALALEFAGHKNKEFIDHRVKELLEIVGLSDKARNYPSMCSGGQKQRVAIARALANNPTVLFSDESTSALDPKTTASILKLLIKLRDELSLTVIMVTHEMEVVKAMCNKVTVLHEGRVVDQGLVKDIINNNNVNKHTKDLLHHADLSRLIEKEV